MRAPGTFIRTVSAIALATGLGLGGARAATPRASLAACDSAPAVATAVAPAAPEARAYWVDGRRVLWPGEAQGGRFRLYYSATRPLEAAADGTLPGADGALDLVESQAELPAALAARFRHAGAGLVLTVAARDRPRLRRLHRGELLLAHESRGRLVAATHLQIAGAFDDLFATAADSPNLGATVAESAGGTATSFRLWAPTARTVSLCLYPGPESPASARLGLAPQAASGLWSAAVPRDLAGHYYLYLLELFVPGVGIVHERVTDPYSVSLNADSRRSYVGRLDAAGLKPPGWDADHGPPVGAPTDLVVYELHVRDFSASDATVPPAHRGKYLAFTDLASNGMRHLASLAAAGLTDVELLPVFDFASVPERGCLEPAVEGASDSERPQAIIVASAARDCYNWGYDPWHFGAPEGSYASDADDAARRILELRALVQALHASGLRVGMDVVYNHTFAAGRQPGSVLDRIVPGYYHRLDAHGAIERSTCCANTATENAMMARLMIDATARFARDYHVDSFRFDLMGHSPRATMLALKRQVEASAGRPVALFGEGWNFGEVADGARFAQASQLSLGGSGIGTFSDRGRDALRGGHPGEHGEGLITHKGFLNGAGQDPRTADLVRIGLAGSLRDYALETADGTRRRLGDIVYAGQPAGYAEDPGEVVNYVENHDNQTLYDLNVLKLPRATGAADRARVQVLGLAVVALSQGIAYFHAGGELLRSKSLDANSFDSGDWFNRLDWTLGGNNFGVGLPPEPDNGRDWSLMRPLLADPALRPAPSDIAFAAGAFRDWLRIRTSSTLFRLRTAADVRERLSFHNTGPGQVGGVVVGQLDGRGYPGAGFSEVVYLINAGASERTITLEALRGHELRLHPVQADATAADSRARQARYERETGRFTVPALTAVVFVAPLERAIAPIRHAQDPVRP